MYGCGGFDCDIGMVYCSSKPLAQIGSNRNSGSDILEWSIFHAAGCGFCI
jgi:hypothetical protein